MTPERARTLLFVAARSTTTALVVITAVVLIVLLSADSGLDGISGAIAAGWLVTHQVPLVIGKTSLGLLPLLPTAALMWLTGRDCARAVEPEDSRADLGWIVGAALSGPLLVTAVCLAVAEDASAVVALQPPNSFAAFAWVIGLYLVAAVAGVASRNRGAITAGLGAPEWAVAGIAGAGRTVLRLLGCATAVTVVSFLAHWSRIGGTYATAGGVVGVLGLTLLSVAYLPNAVIGAVGVLVGSGVGVGEASVGVFSVVGGPVPAVPLIAALPAGPAAAWWPVLLLIPAAVGVLGGIDAARTSADRMRTPWATLTSAGLAAAGLLLLGVVAGGDLGTFGRIGVDLPIFAVVTFAWLALAGYAGLLFARRFLVPFGTPPRSGRTARAARDDRDAAHGYRADEYDDTDDEDHYADDHYDDDLADHHDDEYDDGYHDDGYHEDDHYDDHDVESGRYDTDPDDRAPGHRDRDARAYDGDYTMDRYTDEYRGAGDDRDGAEFEAELLDDDPPASIRPARSAPAPDILDAEVVETDSDDRRPRRRR